LPFRDILSFFKEEWAEETSNRVSHLSRLQNKDKLTVLRDMSNEAVSFYTRFMAVLAISPAGTRSAHAFFTGLIDLHTTAKRYRWKELVSDL
jgi:hypothetical protein